MCGVLNSTLRTVLIAVFSSQQYSPNYTEYNVWRQKVQSVLCGIGVSLLTGPSRRASPGCVTTDLEQTNGWVVILNEAVRAFAFCWMLCEVLITLGEHSVYPHHAPTSETPHHV